MHQCQCRATSYLAGLHRLFLEAKLAEKDHQTALQEANARAYEMETICLDPLARHLHQLFVTDDDLFFDVHPDEWKQLQQLDFWQLSLMQEVSRIRRFIDKSIGKANLPQKYCWRGWKEAEQLNSTDFFQRIHHYFDEIGASTRMRQEFAEYHAGKQVKKQEKLAHKRPRKHPDHADQWTGQQWSQRTWNAGWGEPASSSSSRWHSQR